VSHRTVRGRLALTSLLSVVALLAIALPSGATTNPEEVGGNPTCADLGYGQGYGAFKIDPPRSGDFTSPDGKLTVTLAVSGKSLGFTTNIPVAAVIVKGGDAANVYRYGSGSTGDSGLYAPINASGGPAGLSHVDFCYKPQTPPPPPPDCSTYPKPDGCEQPPPPDCTANPKPQGCEQPPPPDCTANPKPEGCPKPPPPPVNPPQTPPTNTPTTTPPAVSPPVTTPAVVTPAAGRAPAAAIRGKRVRSGAARMRVPRSCARRSALVRVSGRSMRQVTFFVNGHRVRRVNVRRGARFVVAPVRLRRTGPARQRITARVTFRNGARSRTLTQRATRCARAVVRPQFTG
jgi:hypothetical protein